MTLESLTDWALWYAEHGLAVFPCHAFDPTCPPEYGEYEKGTPERTRYDKPKTPATAHGCNDATTDADQIRAWWANDPNYNIGIATGAPSSGLLVVDLDRHDKDADGIAAFEEWQDEHGELPPTLTVSTPTGGRHVYYVYPEGTDQRCTSKSKLGIDIRATGGYVMAPPSVHPNGEVYEWDGDPVEGDYADADEAVFAFLDYVRSWTPGGEQGGAGSDDDGEGGTTTLEDDELLQKAMSASNGSGDEFKKLWEAREDKDEFTSQSEADFKLLKKLAFWSNRDAEQMERLFRRSARFEHSHHRSTPQEFDAWIKRSIKNAIKEQKDVYRKSAAPRFWNEKRTKFHHETMGDYLIRERRACMVDGAPAVWDEDEGRYVCDAGAWSLAIVHTTRGTTTSQRKNCLDYMKLVAPKLDPSTSPQYVAVKNGLLNPFDPRFGETDSEGHYIAFYRPTPDIPILNVLPIVWDPSAYDEFTDKWLDSYCVRDDGTFDDEKRVNLEEMFALALYRGREVKQSVWVVGEGGNGKTALIDTLTRFIGENNVCSIDIDDMGGNFGVEDIIGKQAIISDEQSSADMDKRTAKLFRKVTAGNKVNVNIKFGQKYDVKPYCKIVYTFNQMPRLSDATQAMMDRIHPILLDRRFRFNKDSEIQNVDVLLDNDNSRSYLLNLALKQLPALVKRGRLTPTDFSKSCLEELMRESDSFEAFVSYEELDRSKVINTAVDDMWDRYTTFCDKTRVSCITHRTFGRRVGRAFNVCTVKDGPYVNGVQQSMFRAR